MPIPSVKGQEAQQKFISRCMGDSVMNKDYPDQKQRAAICYSQWRKSKKRKKSSGSSEDPKWEEQTFDGGTILF